MSRASQITLATTCFTAIGIVGFVHWSQKADKAVSTQSSQVVSMVPNIYAGHAHGCHSRLRATTSQARTTGRLRDAARAGERIPKIPDGIRWRRTCCTATARRIRALIVGICRIAAVVAGVRKAHRHLRPLCAVHDASGLRHVP
jgi:hypothetical protein